MGGGFEFDRDPISEGVQEAAARCLDAGFYVNDSVLVDADSLVRETLPGLGEPSPLALNLLSQVVTTAAIARSVNQEGALEPEQAYEFGKSMRAMVNSFWHEP